MCDNLLGTMGIQNMLKYGGLGLMADMAAWHMTTGKGMFFGGIAGLFTPDSKDMDAVYDGSRFAGGGLLGRLGFSMSEGLFGDTLGRPQDPMRSEAPLPKWAGAAALGVAALTFLNGGRPFNFPLYTFAAGLTPYNSGGIMALARNSGLLPRGWGAGFFS